MLRHQSLARTISAAPNCAQGDVAAAHDVNKWDVLRDLASARKHFALTDRDLNVLQALLSFHPEPTLRSGGALVVYPSNRAICERMNGIANSTMRRHLARLVESGLIARRDSPNGKRYTRRCHGDSVAFGFDLSPLPSRINEIRAAALAETEAQEQLKMARETVSLMRRDLAGITAFGANRLPSAPLWDRLGDLAALSARALRRKQSLEELAQLEADLRAALAEARTALDPIWDEAAAPSSEAASPHIPSRPTEELSTSPAENEQHHQNSNKELIDSERAMDANPAPQPKPPAPPQPPAGQRQDQSPVNDTHAPRNPDQPLSDNVGKTGLPNLPLSMILSTCQEIAVYAQGPIRHWHDFVRAADIVHAMMGISRAAWNEAQQAMGIEEAAVVLAVMLERFGEIRNPGGYLRTLSRKAMLGAFSSGPMIAALQRRNCA